MMVTFTLVASIGQTYMKAGAERLREHPSVTVFLADHPLHLGLLIYCAGAVLVVLALRHGELSVLYPVISLSYVWVALLAKVMIHEELNPMKIAGITIIIIGISILGRGGSK
jgi:drug/metabolite transporter (DMT)-like permease